MKAAPKARINANIVILICDPVDIQRYWTSIPPPSARFVKQGCRLCTYALENMYGRKRIWMTKQKSRGLETDGQHAPKSALSQLFFVQ